MTTNHEMKKIFSVYGIAYLILLTIVLILIFSYPKKELHLLVNSCHTYVQDTFFKHYTLLAEWPLYILALIPLFWKKYRIIIFYAVSEILSGTIALILKSNISIERPIRMFEHDTDVVLPLVEGVNMHHSNSFPSGHSATFFVFFTCFALLLAYYYQQRTSQYDLRKKIIMYLSMFMLFVLASLGAYSRVYLSQHFLSDVCVGSIIGFVTPCLIFYFGKNLILKPKTEDLIK